MPTYQAPRGMRDLLPEEAAGFDRLLAVVLARSQRYGYPRIVTPVVEDREVFLRSAGEASDTAGKEMFEVSLHGEAGLALRPEGTAPVVRAYLEHGLHRAPQPVRFFYWEPMFRGQRPQKLRWRQFWQWGLEIFGAAEPASDIEVIELTNGLLADVGLTDFVLKVNTVGDTASQVAVKATLTEYFSKYRDQLDDDCKLRLENNVLRIFDCKNPNDRKIAEGAPKIIDLISDEDRAHFAAVRDGLDRLGIRYEVDDRTVRGFDYYTRTVYEFILTDPEFTQAGDIAVAGGGRYGGVVRPLGGAGGAGAKVAVIRGTEESRGGNVVVKDLVAKEQRVTRLAAVVVEVGRHVPKHPKPRLVDEPKA